MIKYTIDEWDRIISIGHDLTTLDIKSQAPPSCIAVDIFSRSIWEFISDNKIAELFKAINAVVRIVGKPVIIPYRCDTYDKRRFFKLSVIPAPLRSIVYQSTILREEARAPVTLLMPNVSRSEDSLNICTICNRVEMSGSWVDIEDARLKLNEDYRFPKITHCVCPECYSIIIAATEMML